MYVLGVPTFDSFLFCGVKALLKKSFIILKNSPMIVVIFILVSAISAVPVIFLLPDINRMMAFSNEILKNSANMTQPDPQQTIQMLMTYLKFGIYSLVTCGIGIVFMAGFGNMLAAAVNEGKASLKIFFFGIRKFFTKTLLSLLLFAALIFGFSIIISIISVPFTIIGAMNNTFDPEAILGKLRVIQIFSYAMMIFLYPFVELWLPAIFLERNDGVTVCFRKGLKAGIKKYIKLVAVTAVMLLPTFVLFGFMENIYSIMYSPFYISAIIYQVIIMPVILTYLFMLYNENKKTNIWDEVNSL